MSSQVSLDTKTVASTLEDTASIQKLSVKDIRDRVTSIEALQLNLIGMKIGEKILNSLGPANKIRIEQQVMKKKGSPEETNPMAMIMHLTMMSAMDDLDSDKKQFLSDEDAGRFLLSISYPITDTIKDSFARPDWFLDLGVFFQISNYHPMGVLEKTAENLGIDITLNDVPSKYAIYLKLDRELTQQKGELVFALIEEIKNVEFSKKTFTIQELEEEFKSSL